jgi:hypothetical protein
MTEDDCARVKPVIEMAQRLHTSLHGKLIEKGVAPIDAAIAGVYSVHHLATQIHGNPVAAIEWMRDCLDAIERQAMEAPV